MMRIIIPTYRRVNEQLTFMNLPREWHEYVTFVVDEEDGKWLTLKLRHTGAEILVHPPEITSIAKKRAWILANTPHEKIFMLDDDMRFARRRPGQGVKLFGKSADTSGAETKVCNEELTQALISMDLTLDSYAHAGWSARQGNNGKPEGGWHENKRMMYALGYNVPVVRRECVLGRIEHREDMELSLQLLVKGFPNAVDYDTTSDQKGYGKSKGGTEGRSIEASNKDALLLAEWYPGLVKAVEKKYGNTEDRVEVVVQWEKAFASAGIRREIR